ncbi:MAG: type IX secretion system membrane protein PorP/SprF [Bacteroidales bacterium]|nr:type IX secretion system membrane protein PorP/SprF [Bacteroidales bacterium]
MRKSLLILFISVLSLSLFAQQDYQVSQYMFDQISFNPGAAGNHDVVSISGILRNQWTGMEGTPEDIILSASIPFRLFKKDHGVGLTVFRELIGFQEDIDLKVAYAYRANIGDGKLGIGAGVNITNRGFKPDNWFIPDRTDLFTTPELDDAIPKSEDKVFAIDFSFGFFYKTEDLYLGISSTHLNETSYKFYNESSNNETSEKITRHYYITSGYNIQLANPSFEVIPSILIQSDGKIHKFDLNAVLSYNKKFWGGVSIRPGGAIVGMLGFEILNGAKIGFAYDFPTTSITNYYQTAYEILINYSFRIGVDKTPQKYKSIRFL